FAYNTNGTTKESTKYATRYDSSDDKAGDAIRGWFSDYSNRAHSGGPFFVRGGYWNNSSSAGLFASGYTNGVSNSNNSFRVVLAF
ncbi:MAG: hypothetical protein Q4G05_01890, partial [Clostridia bacterium]|nr:hypothetical protein [Clostridia bacterium]